MSKKRFIIEYLRVNFWGISSSIFAAIAFVFVILPFLANLKFVNTFLNTLLANSNNIKLIIGTSSILQLTFISFAEKSCVFIQKYFRSIKKGIIGIDPIFLITIFVILSIVLIKFLETQYNIYLLVTWKCFLFFMGNLVFAFLIWELRNLIGRLSFQFNTVSNRMYTGKQPAEYVLTDDPITSPSEDLLDRKKLVKDVYKEIVNFPSDGSFVFGLYGGWGEGKTSFLNLLKQKFKDSDNFLIFDFNPWYFKDKEITTRAFYNGLENALNEEFILPGFSKAVEKYLRYISFGTNIGINFRLNNINKTLEEMKQKIESYLEKTNMKFLIVIDDIDRLQSDEVLQIFSLVKCSADLKNMFFVLSFDPVIIEKLLQKGLNSGRQYLEKIVQMPINLPAVPSETIANFLIKNIDKLLERIEIPDGKKNNFYKEFLPTYRAYISKFFRTLRHVKKYINGLSITLPAIKTEVNLNDFLILEVIRVFFPAIYDDIWKNRRFYIQTGWEEDPVQLLKKKEEINSMVKEHIQNVLKETVGENKEQGEILLELLKILFPDKVKNAFEQNNIDYTNYSAFRVKQRLTHPDCFAKYFMLRVPPSELSDGFVEETIDAWNASKEEGKDKSIERDILTLHERKALNEFFRKLRIFIDKIDKNLALHIIKVIYGNTDKFSKEETEKILNSEYDEALVTLLWLINNKIDEKEIQSLLEEIINLTPSIPFAARVVFLYKKGKNDSLYPNIYKSIDFDKLVDVASARLKKHFINEKRDIFTELPNKIDWAFVLYQWASDWMTFKGKNKNVVSNYIISLLKDSPKKFAEFLAAQMKITSNATMAFDLNDFARAYNLGKFINLAEKFKSSPELIDEERKIIEQFLESCRKNPPVS